MPGTAVPVHLVFFFLQTFSPPIRQQVLEPTLLPWPVTMDETTPLLPDAATAPIPRDDQLHRVPSKDFVDFDPNGDDENPLDWPQSYKWVIVALLSMMAFTV